MENLASKYRPKTWKDVTEQSLVVDVLKKMCEDQELTNRNFLLTGPAGCGKAQPLYSKVLTPDGFIRMGDVKVGTKVLTSNGNVAEVSEVFFQGKRPIYEIKLDDNTAIRVADNHINCVFEYSATDILNYKQQYEITTLDLIQLLHKKILYIDGAFNINIPKNNHARPAKIVSIEYIGDEACQCIYVNHKDHTYISDYYIPTHNTTLARLMSHVLNGDTDDAQIIEIDAASHNGVDSVREIVNQAKQYPVGSKWKIFIIDECHVLSSQAWQVLLKVLEEQPARSVMFLCTTNPEKIPGTILSRVQKFQLSKISTSGIERRLKYIIAQENSEGQNITYTDEAIAYLAKYANGGMRDAITTMSKALSYSNDLTIENLEKALDIPSYDSYFKMLNYLTKRDNAGIIEMIHEVYNSGTNFIKWFEEFHSFICQIIKYVYLQDINQTMIPSHYQDKISHYNINHAIVCLKLAKKLVILNRDLRTTQYLQEVAITSLCETPVVKK